MQLAIFGISNSGLNLAVNLIVLFLVAVWLALVYWTFADARRRTEDPLLIACATAASLIPYLGSIVYAILRPPEYIEDRHERDLEIRATELRVRQLAEQACPHCEYPIDKSYLRCPSCRRRVKEPCVSCGRPLDPRWGVCPYCETEVAKRKPAPRQGGGRRAPAARQQAPRQQPREGGRAPAEGGGQQRAPRQQRPKRPPQRADSARSAPEGGGQARTERQGATQQGQPRTRSEGAPQAPPEGGGGTPRRAPSS
jgi:hypothetical protein